MMILRSYAITSDLFAFQSLIMDAPVNQSYYPNALTFRVGVVPWKNKERREHTDEQHRGE